MGFMWAVDGAWQGGDVGRSSGEFSRFRYFDGDLGFLKLVSWFLLEVGMRTCMVRVLGH